MARLSIILPAYNRAAVLPRAVASALAQDGPELELIVADDASTDGTLSVLPDDPRVRVVRLAENRGAGPARNAAAELATGDYWAFLDSDDVWLPGKILRQLEVLDSGRADLVGTAHLLVSPEGEHTFVPPPLDPSGWRRRLHSACAFHGGSTPLFRREVWERTGPMDPDLRVLEDWDWLLRVSQSFRIATLAEPLVRVHENRPASPAITVACTRRFVEKHAAEFAGGGPVHAARVRSQHWENVARCCYRARAFAEGNRWLWRALREAPGRQPLLGLALPLACWDAVAGTDWLGRLLAARQRRSRP